jgi:hypothetical protein
MATSTSPTHPSQADAAVDDPLAKLHKMSTTAGVASQQYVAINTAAVLAASLGVASALSIFTSLLLIIPVAGAIVSIVAWRQIANSNGTETGRPLALVGLALSLLFGGGVLARDLTEAAHDRANARQMDASVQQLTAALKAGNYDAAYKLFAPAFQSRVPRDQFEKRWVDVQAPNYYGPLQSLTWNGVLPQYELVEGGNARMAIIYVAIRFSNSEGRFTFAFREDKDAGNWQIYNIPEVFPFERAAHK